MSNIFRSKPWSLPAVVVVLLSAVYSSSPTAFAGPLSDGNAAYKAHDYADAVNDYKAAVSQLSGPEQAKAYYKLGLAYHKQLDSADASASFLKAQSLDPTLSFASSPDKFNHLLSEVQSAAPLSTTKSAATTASTDAAANALTASTVYIDPNLAGFVNQTTLEASAESDNHTTGMAGCPLAGVLPDSHTIVKMAVLTDIPGQYGSAAEYASRLHDYLSLGSNGLIVVGEKLANGQPGGIGVASSKLSVAEENALAQKYVAQIGSGNMTAGLSALAKATAAEIDYKERIGPETMSAIVFIVIVAVILLLFLGAKQKKAKLQGLRIPLNTLKDNVLQNIQYIDNYADVLPKNNADTDQVRAYRQAAEAKYEQADKIINKATDESELYRAQSILDKANADIAKAKHFLDKATGGASAIPGDDAVRPASIPESHSQAQQIPTQQRGVSFFSSQPAPISGLLPVTLNIDGTNRTVMATPEEAAQIRSGNVPPVRGFNYNGQLVPWYNYPSYDPYRDYYEYENRGWGGFGSGAVAGFIGAEMLDSLFRPNYYGGWSSPYGYSPGYDSFGGWNSYGYDNGYDQGFFQGEQNANQFAFQDQYNQPPQNDSGGASFMGSGYDSSDYNNSGGSSFIGSGDRS